MTTTERAGAGQGKPIAIDLFCGLRGWTSALINEGWHCIGFDIEQHVYDHDRYPGQLVIQDVLTLDGAQFKDAAIIVASPPCTEYSYMAMPWSRAKQIARALRGDGEFPEGYKGSRTIADLTRLFDACFRIQREASEAAGRRIPLVVENVKGAQPWVGRAAWNFGSFYLWGDVPALMPMTAGRAVMKEGIAHRSNGATNFHGHTKNDGGSWFNVAHNTTSGVGQNPDGRGVRQISPLWRSKAFANLDAPPIDTSSGVKVPTPRADGVKHGGEWFHDPGSPGRQGGLTRAGVKQPGIAGPRANGKGDRWFQDGAARHGSKSSARKAASARIAKIPPALAQHVARCYLPAPDV